MRLGGRAPRHLRHAQYWRANSRRRSPQRLSIYFISPRPRRGQSTTATRPMHATAPIEADATATPRRPLGWLARCRHRPCCYWSGSFFLIGMRHEKSSRGTNGPFHKYGHTSSRSTVESSTRLRSMWPQSPADPVGSKRKLIKDDTRVNLLGNQLVLIAPKDSKLDSVAIGRGGRFDCRRRCTPGAGR